MNINRTARLKIRRAVPLGNQSGILRSVSYIFSANILSSVLTLGSTLLITRWVSPDQMGVWAAARVIVPYISMLHLGVFSGLNRELPFNLGKNEHKEAVSFAQVSLAWAWRASSFLMFTSIVIFGLLIYKEEVELAWATLTLCISIGIGFFAQHYSATYKSHSEFALLAQRNALVALAGIPLMAIVWLFSYSGLLLRYFSLQLGSLLILLRTPPFPVKPSWNLKRLWHLIKVGIPIALVGNCIEALKTLDSIAITKHSGTQILGLYIISIQVSAVGTLLARSFTTVVYPAMSRKYGATGQALPVFWLSCRAAGVSLIAGIVVAFIGWITLPHFVSLFLPKYVEGIQAAQWSALIPLVASLTVVESVFNVLKHQELFFLSAGISAVTFFAAWTLLANGRSDIEILESAAQAKLISLQARSLVSLLLAGWLCFRHDALLNRGS